MRKRSFILLSVILLLSVPNVMLFAEDVSSYIIMGNIAPYERLTKTIDPLTEEIKTIPGYWIYRNSGVLVGTGHFLADHTDVTYKTKYQSEALDMGMSVQVTQHAGADSDRWLAHEVDAAFRTSLGIPGDQYIMRVVNGNNVMTFGSAGWVYRWISNNKVISIEYEDGQMNKPEPLEVVQAYLAKFPSTLPALTSADLRTSDNQIKWIKDEMERRLWLCDKWNIQNQAGKVTPKDMIYSLSRSLEVFIHYRQKYYGVSADTELKALRSYKMDSDLPGLQTKLTQYKTWWNANKGKSISLP